MLCPCDLVSGPEYNSNPESVCCFVEDSPILLYESVRTLHKRLLCLLLLCYLVVWEYLSTSKHLISALKKDIHGINSVGPIYVLLILS